MDHSVIIPINLSTMEDVFKDTEELSLSQQFQILSACPNFHHWISKANSGIKMHHYFVPMGRSPRNLVLGELELGNLDLVRNIVMLILQDRYHIEQMPKKNRVCCTEVMFSCSATTENFIYFIHIIYDLIGMLKSSL